MSHLHHRASALVDGELHGRARRRAIRHARHCAPCRRELEQTAALKRRLLGLAAAEPPSDLRIALGSLHCDVAGSSAARPEARSGPFRLPHLPLRMLAGAGTVSVGLLVAAYALGGAPAQRPTVSPPVDELAAEFVGGVGAGPLSEPAVDVWSDGREIGHSKRALAGVPLRTADSSRLLALASTGSRGDDTQAVAILEKAAEAPESLAYVAVRDIRWSEPSGEAAVRLRVEHAPGQGTTYGLVGDDASPATFVNDRELGAGPAGGDVVGRMVESYDVAVAGTGRLLGRPATIVTVSREGRLAAQLWIDDATGLLLRRSVYDDGELVRSSTVTALRSRRTGFLAHLPPAVTGPSATRVSTRLAAALSDRGWACPPSLPGDFSLTRLHRLDGRRDIMQASYTDGLFAVSVFEERGRLDISSLAGFEQRRTDAGTAWVRPGLPTVIVWEGSGTVYTLVTDAPAGTWTAVVAALPHGRVDPSASESRLERGLARMADAFHLPH